MEMPVLLGSYVAFLGLALAWLHRDMVIGAVGLALGQSPARLLSWV